MRVGIDYQILALGPDLITRGMGRYTQQQLREVLALDHDNEYVLLSEAGADLTLIAPDLRDAGNVDLRVYAPPRDGSRTDPDDLLRRAEHYQAWIARQDIDVYHATAPLLLTGPPLVRFDVCPMVATLYDLIPLRFPDHYLDERSRDPYLRTLALVARADRLIAISETARQEAVDMLGVPRERLDRAWPIPDDVFRPLPAHSLRKLLVMLGSHLRIPERYVLTVSHIHHSKNLLTLLAAYAALPPSFRTSLPLVICCHLDPASEHSLRVHAEALGLGDDVVITGHVSDEELCALYNRATMVVHPSRSEGFGFPVLEAMACGAPVVTTTAASLPEVAGDAAILVDPDDAAAFTDAIRTLAGDAGRREDLRQRGFEQARKFNRQQLGEATLRSYQLAAAIPGTTPRRPRIAMWSPLPPQPTGIADYSAELLEALEPRCDLEVFVDGGYLPEPDMLERHRVHHHSAFARREAHRRFDGVIYQVGASPVHHYMSEALRTRPGIVALHDLIWSNVLYTAHSHVAQDPATFRRMLGELHGRRALQELDGLDFDDQGSLWDFFGRYPMLEPVIGTSLAQVVHFPALADELLLKYPESNPRVVTMGVADPFAAYPELDREGARVRLGIKPDRFVAGIFGIVHPLKRIETCIKAAGRLLGEGLDPLMFVVGASYDEAYGAELAALARALGLSDNVMFTGRVDHDAFAAYLVAADVVVNLRAPVHKHMSATAMRAIAAGRPLVISDLPEWRFLPGEACLRVPPDCPDAQLAGALRLLAGDPQRRDRMAAAARDYYETEGTIERMAERYLAVIAEMAEGGRPETIESRRTHPESW